MSDKLNLKRTVKTAFLYFISSVVLMVFAFKGIFLMAHYGIEARSRKCGLEKNDTADYVFTVTMYGIISLLRLLEYSLLVKQFYSFIFVQDKVLVMAKNFFHVRPFFVFLLPYIALGMAIPSVGIYQELEISRQREECDGIRHYFEIYLTYSAINYFRYISASLVRMLMILTTLTIRNYWHPDNSWTYSRDGSQNDFPNTVNKLLEDWKVVTRDHQERAQEYARIGTQVQEIQKLFQTWFIVPWVAFLLNTSIKTHNVLRPWISEAGDVPPKETSKVFYLLCNVNQFICLLIPYLCACIINTYHQNYYKHMRNQQLKRFEASASRYSIARQLVIEKEEEYDFLPRVVGTNITISMGSTLYVFFLLIGLFFSTVGSLF